MAGGVTQIHYSPVTNVCAATVDNGDLLFLNPKELHYECPLGKSQFYERRILCAMDIKQLNGEPLPEPPKENTKNLDEKNTYKWKMFEEKENYGLVFKPFLKVSYFFATKVVVKRNLLLCQICLINNNKKINNLN